MAANNIIMRSVAVTETFAALSAARCICDVEITCAPGNTGAVTFLGDDGETEVEWVAGEYHEFKRVDLSAFSIKGTADDVVTIIGHSVNE